MTIKMEPSISMQMIDGDDHLLPTDPAIEKGRRNKVKPMLARMTPTAALQSASSMMRSGARKTYHRIR